MKNRKLRFVGLCLSTVLTLGLAYSTARASGCSDIIAGGNAYGNFDCRLLYSCGGWCYYNCTCSNTFPEYGCDAVLIEAGFVLNGPPCGD